jgi:Raf kinase inhibitor-like YbhB/YbcL family protein
MALRLRSPAFGDGAPMPDRYTKGDRNISPPLEWSNAPEGTRSFVLVVEDPDSSSGTFRHWAVYNIPGDKIRLDENEDVSKFSEGVNDFGNQDYDGPQPAVGSGPHHYRFRLAALDTDRLEGIQGKAKASAIWDKAQPHILDQTELVGTYETRIPASEAAG